MLKSVNAYFINEVVSLRRAHEDSIRGNIVSESDRAKSLFYTSWYTYLDVKNVANINEKKHFLKNCIKMIYRAKKQLAKEPYVFLLEMFKTFKLKGVYYILFILGLKINKAYYFEL